MQHICIFLMLLLLLLWVSLLLLVLLEPLLLLLLLLLLLSISSTITSLPNRSLQILHGRLPQALLLLIELQPQVRGK